MCTLRAAIQTLNAWAASHNYTTTNEVDLYSNSISVGMNPALNTPDEDNGFSGDLDIRTNMMINGIGYNTGSTTPGSTVGWSKEQNDRIFHIVPGSGINPVVVFNNLIIRDGFAINSQGVPENGGGILADVFLSANGSGVSTLTLNNSNVLSNTSLSGGGIMAYGPLTLNNVTVSSNKAYNNCGGVGVLQKNTQVCGAACSTYYGPGPVSTMLNAHIDSNVAGFQPTTSDPGNQGWPVIAPAGDAVGGGFCSISINLSNRGTSSIDLSSISNNIVGNSNPAPYYAAGGGTAFSLTTATIKGTSLDGNQVTDSTGGGAMYAYYSVIGIGAHTSPSPTVYSEVNNNTLSGSNSVAAFGGAGLFFYFSAATIAQTTISGNVDSSTYRSSGTNYPGGGVLFQPLNGSGGLLMVNDIVTKNSSGLGGGVLVAGGSNSTLSAPTPYPTANIIGSTIDGNLAADGAGLYVTDPASTVYVSYSTLSNNGNGQTAAGGGLFNKDGSVYSINNTYSANRGTYGGAVVCSGAGTIRLFNDTVVGNTGSAIGGGLYSGCQTYNAATGITTPNPTQLSNTILAGNFGGSTPDCAGTVTSNGYNLVQTSESTCAGGLNTSPGRDITGQAANLAVLGAYPYGATAPFDRQTMLPQSTSPAIDHVPASACTYNVATGGTQQLPLDERAAPRPSAGPAACDIGAVEIAEADLGIVKTVSPANGTTVSAGTTLTYTLVVTNYGPLDATGALVNDALSSEFSGATWTCIAGTTGASCPASGSGSISNASVTLPAPVSGTNAFVTFTVSAPILASATTSPISNTATVANPPGRSDPPTDPHPNSSSVSNPLQSQANITITKTSSGGCGVTAPGTVTAGQPISYTITVTNSGPSDAAKITTTDNFPGVTIASWTCTASGGATCVTKSGTGHINNNAVMPAGSQVVYQASGSVVSATTGSINNIAGAVGGFAKEQVTCVDNVIPAVNLVMLKTVSQPTVLVGGTVTYTLTGSNNGPSALSGGATITDTIPASLTIGALPAGCTRVGQVVTCGITTDPFMASAQQSFAIPVTAMLIGHFDNTAVISTTATVSDPSKDNTSTVSLQVKSPDQADLGTIKSASPTQIDVGGDVTFTLTATNSGPAAATGVSLTDVVPTGLTYKSSSVNGASCAFNSGTQTVTCDVGVLANGASASAIIVATATAAGMISNTDVVNGDQTDPNGSNDNGKVTIGVTGVADLSIVKTGPATATQGQDIAYELTVTNAGPNDAAQVTVTDMLPSGVSYVSATGDQGTCTEAGGVVTCTLVDLPALAGSNTAVFTVVVTPTTAGQISNTATVAGSGTDDPDAANNTSRAVTTDVQRSSVAPQSAFLFRGGGFGCQASGSGSPWALLVTGMWLYSRRRRR